MDNLKANIKEINHTIDKFFSLDLLKLKAFSKIYKTHVSDGGKCPNTFANLKKLDKEYSSIRSKLNSDKFKISKCIKEELKDYYICSNMRKIKNKFFIEYSEKLNKYIEIINKNLRSLSKNDKSLIFVDYYYKITNHFLPLLIQEKELLDSQNESHRYPFVMIERIVYDICGINKTINRDFKQSLISNSTTYFKQLDKRYNQEFNKLRSSLDVSHIRQFQYDLKSIKSTHSSNRRNNGANNGVTKRVSNRRNNGTSNRATKRGSNK